MNTPDSKWNQTISGLPGANFMQTVEWAAVKAQVGWRREELTWQNDNGEVIAAAQLLTRSTRLLRIGPRVSIGYIPRGPLLDWSDHDLVTMVLADLEKTAMQRGLVFLKIDPEVPLGELKPDESMLEVHPGENLLAVLDDRGWRFSPDQVQFRNTMVLSLQGDESTWLARMKQKSRYNLRLAQKSGVLVRKASSEDLPLLYQMFVETANRDGFIIRPETYYLDVWRQFMRAGMADGLIAEYAGMPIAGLVLIYFGARAWFVYGMSTAQHRDKMPNYLLQWEAMRLARAKGCQLYDLWGAPDTLDESDPMFGVYRFKEGMGAKLLRTIGAWDFPVQPFLYRVYHQLIPRLLSVTRFLRKKQLMQEVS